jgi:2-C-methyl-D-erythritol 4-phosphate cytidylyltransferase
MSGGSVKIYRGSNDNIKITTPEDLVVAEILLKKREDLT